MTKITNLIGMSFGMLKVEKLDRIGSHGKEYLCKCACGKTKTIRGSTLTSKKQNSCGCLVGKSNKNKRYNKRALSKVGEKHNRLTVIGIEENKKGRGYFHITKCDCGNITKNIYADLVSGKVISCGCYGKEQQSKTGSRVGLNNGTINCSKRKWGIEKDGVFIRMRSGYEVMYAMILDKENIKWEYEPKRFKLKEGVRYTPDFYLKEQDLWIDVKGRLTEKNKVKHKLFEELGYNFKLVFIEELQKRLGYSYYIFKKQWDIKSKYQI